MACRADFCINKVGFSVLTLCPVFGVHYSHGTRTRSVSARYGRISDKELIAAIDRMTFDHGHTEIWLAKTK
jgi:hypothetical protein